MEIEEEEGVRQMAMLPMPQRQTLKKSTELDENDMDERRERKQRKR